MMSSNTFGPPPEPGHWYSLAMAPLTRSGMCGHLWRAVRRHRRCTSPGAISHYGRTRSYRPLNTKCPNGPPAIDVIGTDRPVVLLERHSHVARRDLEVGLTEHEERAGDLNRGASTRGLAEHAKARWTRIGRRNRNRNWQEARARHRPLEL